MIVNHSEAGVANACAKRIRFARRNMYRTINPVGSNTNKKTGTTMIRKRAKNNTISDAIVMLSETASRKLCPNPIFVTAITGFGA